MKETMNINHSNYEAYFLDYFEKNLDTTGVAELMIFLEVNPELKAEFENFELLFVSPDTQIVFEYKESLKKKSLVTVFPIHEGNYEEYMISSVENMLNEEEEEKLAAFINLNPIVAREFELFRMTVLQPDTNIIFEAKDSLKHEALAPVVSMHSNKGIYTLLAVAASLTILIVFYFTLNPVKTGLQLAQQNQPAIHNSTKGSVNTGFKETPVVASTQNSEQPVRESLAYTKTTTKKNKPAEPNKNTNVMVQDEPLFADASLNSIPSRSTGFLVNPYARTRKIKSTNRTEFSDIYHNYMLRNQIEYSQYLDEQRSRSLLARTFDKLRQGISGEDEFNPNADEEQNVLWSVADLGVKGFNAVTNSDLRLVRKINSEGRTQSYAVKSDRVEYSKGLDK